MKYEVVLKLTTAGKVCIFDFSICLLFSFLLFFCSQQPALGWQGHEGRTSHCCCSSRCFGHLRRHSIDELLKVSPFCHPRNGCDKTHGLLELFFGPTSQVFTYKSSTNPATNRITFSLTARMTPKQHRCFFLSPGATVLSKLLRLHCCSNPINLA